MTFPLRVERFNDHGRHPNKLISFIKQRQDRPPADQKRALNTLNRLAAFVYPIMRANGLQVTSLEEHDFNREYAGINYNAGECIGLVLRTKTGDWMPESFVLGVLLHELSHCTNMHHAKPFWVQLQKYQAESAGLKTRGYTGEGFWSQGTVLGSSERQGLGVPLAGTDLPRTVCGGSRQRRTYRRKTAGGSRKRGKQFGPGGAKLGGNLTLRSQLDGGKSKATPRVVNSKRGKELRASAAEMRLSSQVTQVLDEAVKEEKKEVKDAFDSDSEEEVTELSAYKMEDENAESKAWLKQEMDALLGPSKVDEPQNTKTSTSIESVGPGKGKEKADSTVNTDACPICTMDNAADEVTCDGCGTLRDEHLEAWQCKSTDCAQLGYRNPMMRLSCGFCESKRPD